VIIIKERREMVIMQEVREHAKKAFIGLLLFPFPLSPFF
jgi:hypothetical protein